MNLLEFISSLVWPAVAVGALVMLRKPVQAWAKERPNVLRVGPFEAEWNNEYQETAEALHEYSEVAGKASEGSGETEQPGVEPSGFAIQFRDLAHKAPVEAILGAWWSLEEELRRLALTVPTVTGRPARSAGEMTAHIKREGLLPSTMVEAIDSLRRMRNLAVHGRESVSTTQVFEFLNLVDAVMPTLSAVRAWREREG